MEDFLAFTFAAVIIAVTAVAGFFFVMVGLIYRLRWPITVIVVALIGYHAIGDLGL